jgi:hypothetical protein
MPAALDDITRKYSGDNFNVSSAIVFLTWILNLHEILLFLKRLTARERVVRKCDIKCIRCFEKDIASSGGADSW